MESTSTLIMIQTELMKLVGLAFKRDQSSQREFRVLHTQIQNKIDNFLATKPDISQEVRRVLETVLEEIGDLAKSAEQLVNLMSEIQPDMPELGVQRLSQKIDETLVEQNTLVNQIGKDIGVLIKT